MQTCEQNTAVKRNRVFWLIEHAPPETPACFDSKTQWQDYLRTQHASGEKITKISDTGKWTVVDGKKVRTERTVAVVFDRIDYCQDCDIGGAKQMQKRQAGRCMLPPLPYRTQLSLLDAATDTLIGQRDQVAAEAARARVAAKLERAAAFLKEHGFDVVAPSKLGWMGVDL